MGRLKQKTLQIRKQGIMVRFCCIRKLPKSWWLKITTIFYFSCFIGGVSVDLYWDWHTLCICLYLADLGWALLIFWGWSAIGCCRRALLGQLLSSLCTRSFPSSSLQRQQKCAKAYAWEEHLITFTLFFWS